MGVLGRQRRRAVEARSAHRRVPRPQGDGVSKRLGQLRSRNRPTALSARHLRAQSRRMDRRVPEHGGRQELARDELSPSDAPIDHSLEPKLRVAARTSHRASARRRQRRRRGSALLYDAGHERQRRQARRVQRRHARASLVARAARVVHDVGAYRRPAASRSPATSIAASRPSTCATAASCGRRGSQRPCKASRSASRIDGKQYIAVATGLGGGSPRGVPATITPEIRPPNRGHALYVFALP